MLKIEDDEKIEDTDEEEITSSIAIKSFIYLILIVSIGLLIFYAFDKYFEYSNYKSVSNYLCSVNNVLSKNNPIPLTKAESIELELTTLSVDNFNNKKLIDEITKLNSRLPNQLVMIPTGQYIKNWVNGQLYKAEIDTVVVPYKQKFNYQVKTIIQPITTIEKKAYEISIKHPDWTKEVCLDLANQRLWIGMTKEQLILAWGKPREVDKNISPNSQTEQWIYGNLGPYVYLEAGFVTSWQN